MAGDFRFAILYLIAPFVTLRRIGRAHFSWDSTLLAPLGLPLFSYLLLRSRLFHKTGRVSWKGRIYAVPVAANPTVTDPMNELPKSTPTTAGRLS